MKRIKFTWLLVTSVLLIGLIAGCAAPTAVVTPSPAPVQTEAPTTVPTPAPIVVTDAVGRTVEFATPPQRIVVAGKAAFMIMDALFMFPEAPDRIFSYENRLQTKNDFIQTTFPKMQSVSLLEKDASAEQIAPLNPDLVIMKSFLQDTLGKTVEALGIKVVYLNLETIDQFYKDVRTIGQIFGDSAKAEELVSLYQNNDKVISAALAGVADADKPSVLLLQYSNKGGEVAFSVPPASYLQTLLVEKAGGIPVWKEAGTGSGFTIVSLEQIAAWNPKVILIVDYAGNAVDAVATLKQDSKWQALDAVKNNMIYAFPLDFQSWDQPDTRWTLGEFWMATKLFPDRFTSVKMLDEVTSFYKNFYSLDDSTITNKILPLLKGDL
jgi:iron complex transport system substrate-binding protein